MTSSDGTDDDEYEVVSPPVDPTSVSSLTVELNDGSEVTFSDPTEVEPSTVVKPPIIHFTELDIEVSDE